MTIRDFQPGDLAAVKRLVDHTIDVSYADTYAPEAIQHFKHHHRGENILADAAQGHVVVIEREGEIVATATLVGAEIRRLFVHPELQRQGLGARLMRELESRARAAGVTDLVLAATVGSRTFYERLHYAVEEEKAIPLEGGAELRFYVMTKRLGDAE